MPQSPFGNPNLLTGLAGLNDGILALTGMSGSSGSMIVLPRAFYPVRGVCTTAETLTAFDSVTGGTPRDGVTYVAGDRVLLVNQATASQNGPWVVGTVASGTAPLTRPVDWVSGTVQAAGALFAVSEGTAGAFSLWQITTAGAITVDTTSAAINMVGGNWGQMVSTTCGTQTAPSGVFIGGVLLTCKWSGIFRVDVDMSYSDATTAETVTCALVSDTSAAGVLGSANKVAHGVGGLGTFGTNGFDAETIDTNGGAALTYNAAAWNTSAITQKTDITGNLTGLLTANGSGTNKFSFHGVCYNAAPTGTTKTAFTRGNTVGFGVKITAAAGIITIPSLSIQVTELPAG